MPTPRKGEDHDHFMQRCMAWPDLQDRPPAQREAICQSKWEKGKEGKMKSWYRVENRTEPEADLFVYNEIGGMGITAADFVADLKTIKARKINLHLNSPGGDVFDAITMYTALKQHGAQIEVYVDGLAASAASLVAMAGQRVIMAKHAFIMVHEAHGLTLGNAADMRKAADLLDLMSDNIAGIYAEKTGGSKEDWRAKMAVESWFGDQEAVAVGLADEVSDGVAPQNTFDLSKFKRPPEMPHAAPEPETEPEEEEAPPIDYAALFAAAVEGVL